jgi:hypothetical protein
MSSEKLHNKNARLPLRKSTTEHQRYPFLQGFEIASLSKYLHQKNPQKLPAAAAETPETRRSN